MAATSAALLVAAAAVTGARAASDSDDAPAVVAHGSSAAPAARRHVVRASVEASGYHDTDSVNVASPTIAGSIADPIEGWSVGGRYLVDAVSAASVDIVSSASPNWTELRHVGSVDVAYKPHDFGIDVGGGVSREPDYLAISGGGTLMLDLFDKNATAVVGYSYGNETAGIGTTPFAVFSRKLIKHGLRAGATVVVDPATTFDFMAEGIFESGNQSKPYRFIPLFAPGTAARIPAGASVADVNNQRLSMRPGDQLPLSRTRYASTGRLAHRFSGSALHLEERLYSDDWGLKASTSDLRYVIDVGRSVFIWPHLRAHLQSGVDFWKRAYEADVDDKGAMGVPFLRTGDRELGPLHTLTGGAGLRLRLGDGGGTSWTLTLQGDAVFTRYHDALYITQRTAYFAAFSLDAELD
jgi:hypothetical protein